MNLFFFQIWLKEFKKKKKTQRIEFFQYFSNNWFFYDAKNWTLFSLSMTQRIEPFFVWLKELTLFFEYDA